MEEKCSSVPDHVCFFGHYKMQFYDGHGGKQTAFSSFLLVVFALKFELKMSIIGVTRNVLCV